MGTAWCCYTWLCVQHGSRCSKVRWQRGSQSWGELRDSSLRLQVCSLCHGSREAPNTTDECSEDWAAECVTSPAQVIFCMQILSRHDLKALADWKSSRTECSGSANCDVDARRRCSTSFTPSTVPTLFDFSLTHSLTHPPTKAKMQKNYHHMNVVSNLQDLPDSIANPTAFYVTSTPLYRGLTMSARVSGTVH